MEPSENALDYVGDAAGATGAREPNIIATCNGKIKTAGGYKWRYAD